ncbi:MAG: hypothetical protein AAGC96_17080 [Pseudomonadota bacterium]
MKSSDIIQTIENDIAYVQSEIDRRRSHIDEDLELIPDPIGRYHNLQRIEALCDQRTRLKLRLKKAKDLVPG